MSVWYVERIIHIHLYMGMVSVDKFHICSHLYSRRKSQFWPCIRTIRELFWHNNYTGRNMVHHYDSETKSQSKQWKRYYSQPPKKSHFQPLQAKSCWQFLGSALNSDDGFHGLGYHSYLDILCFSSNSENSSKPRGNHESIDEGNQESIH